MAAIRLLEEECVVDDVAAEAERETAFITRAASSKGKISLYSAVVIWYWDNCFL